MSDGGGGGNAGELQGGLATEDDEEDWIRKHLLKRVNSL